MGKLTTDEEKSRAYSLREARGLLLTAVADLLGRCDEDTLHQTMDAVRRATLFLETASDLDRKAKQRSVPEHSVSEPPPRRR